MMINDLRAWAEIYGVSDVAFRALRALLSPALGSAVGIGAGSEAQVQKGIRIDAVRADSLLWRNNNGAAIDASGRHIRYGLGNDSKRLNGVFKSSDLIGVTPLQVGGATIGVFTAIEVKRPGWRGVSTDRERAQNNYINAVRIRGGIAGFATSVLDYQILIRKYHEGINSRRCG